MAVWHDGQEPTIGLASDAPGSRPPDRQALAEIGDSAARLATAAGAPCSGADDRTRPGGRPTGTAGAVIGPFAVPVHPPTPGLTGYLGSFSMRTALLVRFDRPWLRGAVLVADLRPGSLADAPRILLSVSALVQVTFEGRLAARREQALHDALSRQVGEAETLKAELTGFTARVCHHLQEPVRRIESIFRLLGRRFAGGLSGKERRCLAGLLQSGRILKERIQNLHRLYRLEQDRTPLEPVQLGKILKEVVRHLDQSIRRRRARISVSSLPWVTANPSQLRELFSSLLCCALHHSPPGKCEMRIGALRWAGDPPGYVRCFIKNSHGSVPSRQSERVRRAISGDSRCDALGELLGLTIARKVVSRHGGRIWMEATPDGGCAFFFTLPACHRRAQPRETDPDPAYPPPPAPARSSPGAQPTSLLLVCPDPLDQETLSEGLRGSVPGGASITTVTSILEALQMTRERHFDLVVSQTDLPDGTGLDLARKLAAGASQLPLVLVGPKGDEASVLEALQAGAADYVRNDELVQASLREAASVVLSNLESERLLARLRSDFVAMVGHDLRNPVANVLSYTDILLDDGLHRLAPEHHQAAVRIKKNALFMMARSSRTPGRRAASPPARSRSSSSSSSRIGRSWSTWTRPRSSGSS
ncbi:MAG: response regulator [Candidatus Riflebacteria bacterium]|nr:response regulator [Candidatus Riflebacteria bacterium]